MASGEPALFKGGGRGGGPSHNLTAPAAPWQGIPSLPQAPGGEALPNARPKGQRFSWWHLRSGERCSSRVSLLPGVSLCAQQSPKASGGRQLPETTPVPTGSLSLGPSGPLCPLAHNEGASPSPCLLPSCCGPEAPGPAPSAEGPRGLPWQRGKGGRELSGGIWVEGGQGSPELTWAQRMGHPGPPFRHVAGRQAGKQREGGTAGSPQRPAMRGFCGGVTWRPTERSSPGTALHRARQLCPEEAASGDPAAEGPGGRREEASPPSGGPAELCTGAARAQGGVEGAGAFLPLQSGGLPARWASAEAHLPRPRRAAAGSAGPALAGGPLPRDVAHLGPLQGRPHLMKPRPFLGSCTGAPEHNKPPAGNSPYRARFLLWCEARPPPRTHTLPSCHKAACRPTQSARGNFPQHFPQQPIFQSGLCLSPPPPLTGSAQPKATGDPHSRKS